MNKILIIAAVVVLLAGLSFGGVKVYQGVRGIRNGNPLNIRKTKDSWQGLATVQSDKEFFIFVEAKWGIRAAARILDNYKKRGVKTVSQIIATWAPAVENNVQAYVDHVVKASGLSASHVPNKIDGDYVKLLGAMIKHENGFNPYSDQMIAESIALA